MKKQRILFFLLLPFISIYAQTSDEFGAKLSGYVNWTALYDSRKVVAAREGHFLLYPREEILNAEGKDLNKVEGFNMAVILTRVGIKLTAPKFLEAKTSGLLETEFMGNSDNDVNGLRIRHAFVNLEWENTSLLLGQTWNPMFIAEAFPLQIGSNGGAPFQPFARNPQIRLTQNINNFRLIAAVVTQRDFTSTGPLGSNGEYLKNATLPDLHFHLQLRAEKNLFGIGGEYKVLKPATETAAGYSANNTVEGFALQGYSKIVIGKFAVAAEGIYGANLTDATMLGGYAVKSVNAFTKEESYTPIKIYSVWIDLTYGGDLKAGLFAGSTKNLGADDPITGKYYSRGSNIDSIYRIAPRLEYQEGKTKFAFEIEYTSAAYGTVDSYGKVKNTKSVGNLRFNTSVFYFF